jgi:hypothetical protein
VRADCSAGGAVDWGRNDPEGADEYLDLDDPVDGVALPVAIVSQAAVNRLIGWPADLLLTPDEDGFALRMDRTGTQLAWLRVLIAEALGDRVGTRPGATFVLRLPVPRYSPADGEGGDDARLVPFAVRHTGTDDGIDRFLVLLVEEMA